jgi:hypothetical protein
MEPPDSAGSGQNPTTSDAFEPEAEPDDAFALDRNQPRLLPFETRLRRLANTLELGVDDPVFDALRSDRLALDGYDHAQGVIADGLWIASRIKLWVRGLRPVCGSSAFATRYPELPADLPRLIRDAWGRQATEADLQAFDDSFAESSIDAAAQREATCLAVLSAAEMVLH